jgi:hypothetical protein
MCEIAKVEKIEMSMQEFENVVWEETSMERMDANE